MLIAWGRRRTFVKKDSTKTFAVWRSASMLGGWMCAGSSTTFSTMFFLRGSSVKEDFPTMLSTMRRKRWRYESVAESPM